MAIITATSDLDEVKENRFEKIIKKMDEFQERDSGWALLRILKKKGNINQYLPIRRTSSIKLSEYLIKKLACINVKNND